MALGQLIVKVGANIAEFQSGMDKASYLANKNFTSMKDAARKASAAMGLAFTAAAGATVALVKHQIDLADNMSLLAQQVGMTTEQLSAFAYAADQNGVGIQEFSNTIAQFAKNVSDAGQGTGQALGAFRAMGINVKDTGGHLKSMNDLLGEFADKIASYRDGTAKTALVVQAFGATGAHLIPLFNGGAAAIAAATKEAKQFGAVISTDTADAANQFNDNIGRMKAIVDGLGNEIMADLMPNLQGLSDSMVTAAKKSDGLGTAARSAADGVRILATVAFTTAASVEIAGTALGGFTAVLKAYSDSQEKTPWWHKLSPALMAKDFVDNISKAKTAAGSAMKDLTKDLDSQMSTLGTALHKIWDQPAPHSAASHGTNLSDAPAIKNMQKMAAATKAAAATTAASVKAVWDSIATPADVLSDKEDELQKLFSQGAIGLDVYNAALAKAKKGFENAANSADPLIAVGKQLHESLQTPMERLASQTEQYNKLLNDGAISFDDYSRAIFEAQDKIQDIATATKTATDFAQDMGLTFSSAFENAIVQGDSFRDMLKGLGQDVLRIATRDLVTNPLGNAVSGLVKNFASELFGSADGNVFTNGNLMAFASGGIVSSPTTFPMAGGRTGLMGEAGPEAVMPLTRGSDGKLGVRSHGGGSGVTIVYNIGTVDARGSDSGSVAQLHKLYQATMNPKVIGEQVQASILKSIHTGGAWARAVGRKR